MENVGLYIYIYIYIHCSHDSGRFVKQEQWERRRAKRKLVSGSKHWGPRTALAVVGVGAGRGHPPPPTKCRDCMYAKSCNVEHSCRKMVRNTSHNAFLNTNSGNAVSWRSAVAFNNRNGAPLEMTPGPRPIYRVAQKESLCLTII